MQSHPSEILPLGAGTVSEPRKEDYFAADLAERRDAVLEEPVKRGSLNVASEK